MEQDITSRFTFFDCIRRNLTPLLVIGFGFILILTFLYYFYIQPQTDIGPEQPIPFSHRVHAGVKEIKCQFCHPYVARSRHPGLPPVEKCLYCHKYIIPEHPEVKKDHWYLENQIPIPWRKVNYLPEHVLFNHERHIKMGLVCDECHGAVEAMDRIKAVRFKMQFCVECHKERKANMDCWLACHS
ncbi:MAG: cytochrome c3 family protein [Deltaproteobacteria bacterium]|nr:cytochrome c3 family protein [Deltaproteobacteria bacterium]MBW1961334.1 cytochrome c3 family protein [Deltaproteobacteria bacterium]MBW1993191.1 cytochrome c3 family protein [Deltaproteobacteria bacterium]MBW2151807.1 cytochrome c3 family protein [Deltaproteobacteria bacterium]